MDPGFRCIAIGTRPARPHWPFGWAPQARRVPEERQGALSACATGILLCGRRKTCFFPRAPEGQQGGFYLRRDRKPVTIVHTTNRYLRAQHSASSFPITTPPVGSQYIPEMRVPPFLLFFPLRCVYSDLPIVINDSRPRSPARRLAHQIHLRRDALSGGAPRLVVLSLRQWGT
ncbi:hypothetical protein DFH09DRAFT_130764 [Mycena vulgaris]|nr:hypothetical protein DFH09DRAFT_130764 [Mycena vulgaris]